MRKFQDEQVENEKDEENLSVYINKDLHEI